MRFVLLGKEYDLSHEDIRSAMRKEEPEPIRNHYVRIDNRIYPPKQVLAAATGLPRVSFTTMRAHNVLRRLGFELGDMNGKGDWKPDPKKLEAARLMDEARTRTGPIGVSVTELIKEGRRG